MSPQRRIITPTFIAFALFWLMLLVLSNQNGLAQDVSSTEQGNKIGENELIRVIVDIDTDPPRQDIVNLGDRIFYTIRIINKSQNQLFIYVDNILPTNSFLTNTLECSKCQKILVEKPPDGTIPSPIGNDKEETTNQTNPAQPLLLQQLKWGLNALDSREQMTMSFSGPVQNQIDGSNLNNRVIVTYQKGPGGLSDQIIVDTTTIVRVRTNTTIFVQQPLWQASIPGGYIESADWGDFDRDGDLDLAVASASTGVYVFRNNNGIFREFWHNPNFAYGVIWGNFITDTNNAKLDPLELIAIGYSSPSNQYTNFVYQYLPEASIFAETRQFATNATLREARPIRYTRSSSVDLIGNVYAMCLIRRITNTAGTFDGSSKPNTAQCIEQSEGIWPLSLADIDNDDDTDLIFDGRNGNIGLVRNNANVEWNRQNIFATTVITNKYVPYDFTWGEIYTPDGYLDLVALFPNEGKLKIYKNDKGSLNAQDSFTITTMHNSSTILRSLDVGDVNSDGLVDLIVGDPPAQILTHTGSFTTPFSNMTTGLITVTKDFTNTQVVRVVDIENDGDLDLFVASQDGRLVLIANPITSLSRSYTPFEKEPTPASSISLGDIDNNGYLDFLLGAGRPNTDAPNAVDTKLYFKVGSRILVPESALSAPLAGSGSGPQQVALADAFPERDQSKHYLEAAVGGQSTPLVVYKDLYRLVTDRVPLEQLRAFPSDPSQVIIGTTALAWGDVNGDGALDLTVGRNQGDVLIFLSNGDTLQTQPLVISQGLRAVSSLAWADFNHDYHLDLAVGRQNYPIQLYKNSGNTHFQLLEPFTDVSATTAIAWADFDSDGDVDLTVGNLGSPDIIYINEDGTFHGAENGDGDPVKISLDDGNSLTTSLDWGDVDGDGDLDLAVGKQGNHDLVYINAGGSLAPLWKSKDSLNTTSIRWGDLDNDGDLDLIFSQEGRGTNGYYENRYVTPSHLSEDFVKTLSLINQPSYVAIDHPGETPKTGNSLTPEILSGPMIGPEAKPVAITYYLYDPDGSRQLSNINAEGDPIIDTIFEYSLDGGGTWQRATSKSDVTGVAITKRLGNKKEFFWDAGLDQAISDDARFRITIIHDNPLGPVQRASTVAVSPPFRVRATTCGWPTDPSMTINPTQPTGGYETLDEIQFTGAVQGGSGSIYYLWNVYDRWGSPLLKEPKSGQNIHLGRGGPDAIPIHLRQNMPYTVTLQVKGDPCPVTRAVSTTQQIIGATPFLDVYLPIIAHKDVRVVSAQQEVEEVTWATTQISGLQANEEQTYVELQWAPYTGTVAIDGYHIYYKRRHETEQAFEVLATVSPVSNSYRHDGEICDSIYYVTAFNAEGDSLPSTASYYTLPCP